MGQRWTWRGLAAGLVLVVCAAAHAGDTTDMARFMPAETAVYVGWSAFHKEAAGSPGLPRDVSAADLAKLRDEYGVELPTWLSEAFKMSAAPTAYAGGVGLFDLRLTEEGPDIQAALLIEAGPKAADFGRLLSMIVEGGGVESPAERRTVAGVTFQVTPIPDTPFTLLWGTHKDCFVLTLGETAAERVVACLNGAAPTLADAEELQFDRRKVAARMDEQYFCMYVNPPRIIARAREVATEMMGELPPIVDQLIDELGIKALKSKYLHVDTVKGLPRLTAFAHLDGPPRGLLALWNQQPLSEDDLRIVPRDAYWAEVGNLDLVALWAEITRVIEAVAPEQASGVQGAVAMSRQMLGFSITDDLLPAFGDTWALFDAPDHGGLLLTGTVLVAEAKDAAALEAVLDRAVQIIGGLLTQTSGGEASLKVGDYEHGGHKIKYVVIAGAPSPVAPAWGFAGGRWVFGLFPQTVAAALKQVNPATRGESILDRPDVRLARSHMPNEFMGFGYFDVKYILRVTYPLINGLALAAKSMTQKFDKFTISLVPPVADLTEQTINYVGTSSRDTDGIVYIGTGHAASLAAMGGFTGAMTASVLLPSLSRAREQAKHAASMSNLRGIAQGCIIYAADNEDRFPASFDELLEADIITHGILTSPFDEEGEVSYVLVPRTRPVFHERDPSRMVLVHERTPINGRVAAAFADGHVELLPTEHFAELLAETYRALTLDEEIPPQFRY